MKTRALLIGINDYHLLGKLRYARQDAEAFAEALCRHCGFTDQEITVMSCRADGATMGLSRYIEHALANLTDARDLDLLVFGFWGHGFSPQPGRRYLCGLDTVESDLERTAVSMDVVKAKLAQVQAENTLLVLDCCQNQPAGRSTAAEPMTDGEEVALASLARDIQAARREHYRRSVPTVAILNACHEGQKAYEWEKRGHGIFTAHLLDGFEQGLGNLASLSTWAVDRVAKTALDIHGQTQIPYYMIEGRGDIQLSAGVISMPAPSPPRRPAPAPVQAPVVWWVLVDGQERGLLDDAAVRDEIRQEHVSPGTQCWRDGMPAWQAMGEMAEWANAFPPVHPAPPAIVRPPRHASAIHVPDFLEPVDGAEFARLGGLAAGSEAAQQRQREWVQKGYPLEVRLKKTGMLFRLVPPGEFVMGSSDDDSEALTCEKPRHGVAIGRPIYVGKFPVIQQEWMAAMGKNPSHFQTGLILKERRVKKAFWSGKETVEQEEVRFEGDTNAHPVESFSWDDCQEFLNRIFDQLDLEFGKAIRLPTEAEWEYACRAGTTASHYGSLGAVGWYDGNSGGQTQPVGQKTPNAWGLCDMHGNVWEWCEDNWHDNYKGAPTDGSAWSGSDTGRVLRGGSWSSRARVCRSARRLRSSADYRDDFIGLRLAVDSG